LFLSLHSIILSLSTLLLLEDLLEGKWLILNASAFKELAHEFDPVEAHGVEEDLEAIHEEEDTEDGEHVAEAA